MKYSPTIGLEIHAELNTDSKLFCSCINNPEEKIPNKNICPVCMGYPGALPVLNEESVTKILKVGQAIGGKRASFTQFDRKHYFYPDIPKGFQISQHNHPLISGGNLVDVEVERIHLEEDTGKSSHDSKSGSLVDFNRSGVPLMELVTKPVIKDSKIASHFAQELQIILKHLGVSKARMEFGEMRVEANISVSKTKELGKKVEVKNINSFKSVEGAIEHEIERQIEVLESGGEVVQETRGWDENKKTTFSQRAKETAKEYRYFKEQDLPTYNLDEMGKWSGKFEINLPEQKRKEYKKLGLQEKQIEVLIKNEKAAQLFDESIKLNKNAKLLANYIITDVIKIEEFSTITPQNMSDIVSMIDVGDISSRGAKDIIEKLLETSGDVKDIADKNNLIQKSNPEELKQIIQSVVSNNQTVVNEYKDGKEQSIQFLVGQVMKESKGSANPSLALELLKKELI